MDDLISRQAAIDSLCDYLVGKMCHTVDGTYLARMIENEVINKLPSARQTGEWLEREVTDEKVIDEWQSAKCSVCGRYHTTPYMYSFQHYNWCPCCGADMRGDNND